MERGLRNLFGNFGWLVAARGSAGLFSLIYLGIATRSLGPIAFGQFTLILSAAQGVTSFVNFQTWQVVIRYGVRHINEGDEHALGRLIRGCIAFDMVSALIGACLSYLLLSFLADYFGLPPELRRNAILFSLALLLSIRSTPIGILRLHDRFSAAAAADNVVPAIRLAGALLCSLFAPTISAFLLAWAVGEVATASTYWILASRHPELRRAFREKLSLSRFEADNPDFARFALASNAGSTLLLAGKQVAVLLVGFFTGPIAAGGFRIAHQIALSIAKIAQLVARAAFPELVRDRQAEDAARIRHKMRVVSMIAGGSAAVMLLALIVGGKTLLAIVAGHAFAGAYPILVVLGAAACIDLATVTFEPMLMAIGRAGTAFLIRLFATIVSLALQVILLQQLGAIGGGLAILAGSIVAAIGLAVAARTLTRREFAEAG